MAVLQIRLENRARKGYRPEQGYLRGMVLRVHPDGYRPTARMSRRSFGWVRVPDLTRAQQEELLEPDYGSNPIPVDPGDDPNWAAIEPDRPRKVVLDLGKLRAEIPTLQRTRHDLAMTWGEDQGEHVEASATALSRSRVSASIASDPVR